MGLPVTIIVIVICNIVKVVHMELFSYNKSLESISDLKLHEGVNEMKCLGQGW